MKRVLIWIGLALAALISWELASRYRLASRPKVTPEQVVDIARKGVVDDCGRLGGDRLYCQGYMIGWVAQGCDGEWAAIAVSRDNAFARHVGVTEQGDYLEMGVLEDPLDPIERAAADRVRAGASPIDRSPVGPCPTVTTSGGVPSPPR